jgi:hypothetical protein
MVLRPWFEGAPPERIVVDPRGDDAMRDDVRSVGQWTIALGVAVAIIGGLLAFDAESGVDAAIGGLVAFIGGIVAGLGGFVIKCSARLDD